MSNFYTDVLKNDARFHARARCADVMMLEPTFRRKVLAIISDAGDQHRLMVYETYRSVERQMQLFTDGVTQLRTVGVHHYGLACDIVYVAHGEPSWHGDFGLLGHLAKAHDLVWGGDWAHPEKPHTFRDYDHVQRIAVTDQNKLFDGSWYPTDSYVPEAIG